MNTSLHSLQPLMMMAGLGLICWLLMRGKLRRRRLNTPLLVSSSLKHNSSARTPHNSFTGTQSLGAPQEVLKWQVELHDLGRELKAELDSKLLAVRAMSLSYDQAARRLGELIRLAEQVELSPGCPLVEARRLSAQGWDSGKIAKALGLPAAEVLVLLGKMQPDAPQTSSRQ
ncbi:MAG: hypothetical protein KDA45_13675 [Planctomycetales bacterium]|nr:hypothetical protein [Planctomycetales bacterium]